MRCLALPDKPSETLKTESSVPEDDGRKTEKRPYDEVDAVVKTQSKMLSAETPKRPATLPADAQENAVSVRERARRINKTEPLSPGSGSTSGSVSGASPVMRQQGALSIPAKTKRDRESRRADDANYDFTLNEAEREWTMRSACSDYQSMAKLLQTNPSLAGRRDFISGYTALHWAAKNGRADVVKLLFGCEAPPLVDARSSGGYTPLHVAAMHGREDIIELLIEVYRADANIRDYDGRKPKHYAPHNLTPRTQQLLASRRDGMMVRSGSYSAKIGRGAQQHGIGTAYPAHREAWSESPSPGSSPSSSSRKGSVNSDSGLMPPPRELPAVVRRRPVASTSSGSGAGGGGGVREKESLSDSEMHRAGSDTELHGSESVPNMGTLV